MRRSGLEANLLAVQSAVEAGLQTPVSSCQIFSTVTSFYYVLKCNQRDTYVYEHNEVCFDRRHAQFRQEWDKMGAQM